MKNTISFKTKRISPRFFFTDRERTVKPWMNELNKKSKKKFSAEKKRIFKRKFLDEMEKNENEPKLLMKEIGYWES